MLHTIELDMAKTVETSNIDGLLTIATWSISSTYHTVLKASSDAAIIGRDMFVDIPFIAAWNKIGEHRQCHTNLNLEWRLNHIMIGLIKLMIKYFLEKMVSSANQKVGMKVILGLSHQFIQMGL
jgi:hypothetical protein